MSIFQNLKNFPENFKKIRYYMNFQKFSLFTYMNVVKMGFFSLSRLEIYIIYKRQMNSSIFYTSFSTITSFATFLIIFSSFSKLLSPEPPMDSTIILLYASEYFEIALLQSG